MSLLVDDMDKTTTRLLQVVLTAVLVVGFFALVGEVFFIAFAGILAAIAFDALVRGVQHITVRNRQAAAALTLFTILLVISVFFFFWSSAIYNQLVSFFNQIPGSLAELQRQFSEYPLIQGILDRAAGMDYETALAGGAGGWLTGILTTAGTLLAIFFLGVYIAFEPPIYRHGVLLLFPDRYHGSVNRLLRNVGSYLQWWLVGKLISMAFVGIIATLGMWLLGIPYAILLGLIAAAGTFVPNIGPVLASIPAMLLALSQGPALALYVAAFYLVVEILESYILTPLIERKTVYLPPALTVLTQILLGMWFGVVGVAVAAPLVVVGMVSVNAFYTYVSDIK